MSYLKMFFNFLKNILKRYFIKGILIWIPIILTFWLIKYIFYTTDKLLNYIPNYLQPENLIGIKIPGLGIIITIILLILTGVFTANVIGNSILKLLDKVLGNIPFIKTVYLGIKNIAESLLSDSKQSFKKPILIQFPNSNSWTIAFISGNIPKEILEKIQIDKTEEIIPVYVPTTPNPTSGYYIMVKKSQTREININTEEAFKFIISLGMINLKEKK